ncbi:MAG: hypothetical protein CMH30_06865 [Micavibrio sp.]|nr:hypothetical protein [Micavibrio sp.]|tara:strand:- start:596 stop:1060 length:465 start_codon:yes stop_codon:yes gene_type:complete
MFELKPFNPVDKDTLMRLTCWVGEKQDLIGCFTPQTELAENYLDGARSILAVFAKSVQPRFSTENVISRRIFFAIHLEKNPVAPLQRVGPVGFVCVNINGNDCAISFDPVVAFEDDCLYLRDAIKLPALKVDACEKAEAILNFQKADISVMQPR